ncbi:MAG: SH3 domain-containing protein [Geitlerinemataceae cyanobacterium]
MPKIAIRNLSLALVTALCVGANLSVPALAAIASVKQEAPSKPRIVPEVSPSPEAKPQMVPQSTSTPQPSSCRRVETSDGELNVRATPAGEIIGSLPDRTLVTIDDLGREGWVPISSPQTGYVFVSYLAPCTEPIAERPTPTSSCRRVAAKEGMPVRQNPSLNSAVLGTVIDGQEIVIVNRGSNGWVPISSPINGHVLAVGLVMCNE